MLADLFGITVKAGKNDPKSVRCHGSSVQPVVKEALMKWRFFGECIFPSDAIAKTKVVLDGFIFLCIISDSCCLAYPGRDKPLLLIAASLLQQLAMCC